MNLNEIKNGEEVKVKDIVCKRGLKHRLCTLGLLKGQKIKMIKNDTNGPLIVQVLDSKIVIGRGQACNITVITC